MNNISKNIIITYAKALRTIQKEQIETMEKSHKLSLDVKNENIAWLVEQIEKTNQKKKVDTFYDITQEINMRTNEHICPKCKSDCVIEIYYKINTIKLSCYKCRFKIKKDLDEKR